MRIIGWALVLCGVAGLFWLIRLQAAATPGGYLFGMPGPAEEASYCLAVAERGAEITRGRAEPRIEAHLDEHILYWRTRAGSVLAPGRAALARDSNAPGVEEQAWLHAALQDCARRAIGFYGHRFASLEERAPGGEGR